MQQLQADASKSDIHHISAYIAYCVLAFWMASDNLFQAISRRGAHPLYRSEPARHDECQCTGNWTRVSQRLVRYLPQTQGLLLIHNTSAEWTKETVHEWLAQTTMQTATTGSRTLPSRVRVQRSTN